MPFLATSDNIALLIYVDMYTRSVGWTVNPGVTSRRVYKPPRPQHQPSARPATEPPNGAPKFNVQEWEAWHYGDGATVQSNVTRKNSWMNLVRTVLHCPVCTVLDCTGLCPRSDRSYGTIPYFLSLPTPHSPSSLYLLTVFFLIDVDCEPLQQMTQQLQPNDTTTHRTTTYGTTTHDTTRL
jgi:hypothetical protein